ncbi:hypothetical protein OH77DRAFT_285271 [Trametes cingulata]|nr:hypothetical protein OH77DRAFT_285271 [Trametes cingulata]
MFTSNNQVYDSSMLFPATYIDAFDSGPTQGLLNELFDDPITMPPPEQFEQDVEDYLFDCSYSSQLPAVPDFDPVSSMDPFSPLSSATLFSESDIGSLSDIKGWSLLDEPADLLLPAPAADGPPSQGGNAFSFGFTLPPANVSAAEMSSQLHTPSYKREITDEDCADMKEDDDDENEETKPGPQPAKRRRRQDTTPRYTCDECGSAFARRHNLKVHVDSVHGQLRAHACGVPGCGRSFSRRHDLTRHHISKHTDQGSPRRKDKSKGNASPERRK